MRWLSIRHLRSLPQRRMPFDWTAHH
jgi:hypothetical protein